MGFNPRALVIWLIYLKTWAGHKLNTVPRFLWTFCVILHLGKGNLQCQGWKRARNRWCLFWTLHNNPGLRPWRKNAIIVIIKDCDSVSSSKLAEKIDAVVYKKEESQRNSTEIYYNDSTVSTLGHGAISTLNLHKEAYKYPIFIDDTDGLPEKGFLLWFSSNLM